MISITPEKIFNAYANSEVDKTTAFHYLKMLLEHSEVYSIRKEALKFIFELNILKETLHSFLEYLIVSDEDAGIRAFALEHLLSDGVIQDNLADYIIKNEHNKPILTHLFENVKEQPRLLELIIKFASFHPETQIKVINHIVHMDELSNKKKFELLKLAVTSPTEERVAAKSLQLIAQKFLDLSWSFIEEFINQSPNGELLNILNKTLDDLCDEKVWPLIDLCSERIKKDFYFTVF